MSADVSTAPIAVTHYTDPGCPWAYSASPAIAALKWRYGDQLAWELVTIGLTEDPQAYVDRGYTPVRQAKGNLAFRRFGMPFAPAPRERVTATGRACRAIVATRLLAPDLEYDVFRALQFTQFCSTELFDTPEGIAVALDRVPGLDTAVILAELDDPKVEAAYQEDRARTRSAAGGPTEFQGKAANSDGQVRFTAPSLVFTHAGGASLEAGGFQPLEAYDVCIANLDVTLERRPPAETAAEVLEAFPSGLTTAEVAAIMAPHLTSADTSSTEASLIDAVADGQATRIALGDDALWLAAR
jgi:protein-disulfide isomerase-like protein with CxxC motif